VVNSHRWWPEYPSETAQGNRRLGGQKEGIPCVYPVYDQH